MLLRNIQFCAAGLLLLSSTAGAEAQITRQPYLQVLTPTGVSIRWNSNDSIIGTVHYGTGMDSLEYSLSEPEPGTFHKVQIADLAPSTKYYYSIDTLPASEDQYFITAPLPGHRGKARIWVISDFGQSDLGDNVARIKTLERWKAFNDGDYHADLVLSLGDQTENDTQEELQLTYFNMLDGVLLNSPLFTVEGNHDNYDGMVNYKATFSLPSMGESGGYPSNTEDYYSLDYGNIHIVVLSTEIDDIDGQQLTWLQNDLKNINKDHTDWLIACLHRPFHSGGYHPTDQSSTAQKQRDYWLRELEDHGVDLILQGHNAIYERSFLIDNLIGKTTELTDGNIIDGGDGREDGDGPYIKGSGINPHQGTIFIEVAPGGNAVSNNSNYQIFSCAFSGSAIEGSVVIDVDGDTRMDVCFLCNKLDAEMGYVWDRFTILQSDTVTTGYDPGIQATGEVQVASYPNPFYGSTNISYTLARSGPVEIGIYDSLGHRLALLEEGTRQPGTHSFMWSAKDGNGNHLPGGIYMAKIRTRDYSWVAKMMLLKE